VENGGIGAGGCGSGFCRSKESEARGREIVGSGERERGAGCGFLCVRERGNGWGREKELTGGPHSSVGKREGVGVLAGCWNWAKQAESEREGREMDFPFLFFPTCFQKHLQIKF